MRTACAFLGAFTLLLTVGPGCHRTPTGDGETASTPLAVNADTVLRLHWVGRRALSVDGSAYYFMRLWDLGDSQKLQDQTLTKLARAVWSHYGQPTDNGAPEAFLFPVFKDLIRAETFVEIRHPPGKTAEAVLAARVDETMAGSWFTNLAATVQLTTGLAPQSSVQDPRSWGVRAPTSPHLIELRRVGGWSILGLAEADNMLLAEVVKRIQDQQRPAPALKQWLTGDVDLARLSGAIGLEDSGLKNLPRASFSVTGDGARVLLSANLKYSLPLELALSPWDVPTTLIHEPLTSFTAVRGVKDWLPSIALWQRLRVGPAPDQFYFWARQEGNFQTYLAAPVPDANATVQDFADRLMTQGNPWLTERGYVPFERWSDGNGVLWGDQTTFRPFLRAAQAGPGSFLFAGFVPEEGAPMTSTIRDSLLKPLHATTNLVYYDWENTQARVEPWLFIGQTARVILRHARLPMETTGSTWLGNLIMKLDASETVITQTGPNELNFIRRSSIGLTAPELHLMVDWLESPTFPRGLYSLVVPPQTKAADGP